LPGGSWRRIASTTKGARGTGRMPASDLGRGLKPRPKRPALIAGVNHLEHRNRPVELDTAATQPGQLPETKAGAKQGEHVVPPEQREAGQQPTGLLGG
jgi:hypothetical protein